MARNTVFLLERKKEGNRFKKFWYRAWTNRELHLMMLLPLIYMILFEFMPMFGLQIAFKDYRPRAGILGSQWVGLKHFEKFFSNYRWPTIVLNTLWISLYSILVGFPIPIFLALCLHVKRGKALKKLTQNVSYIPHFISLVVMVGIINQVFNPYGGLLDSILRLFGGRLGTDLRANPDAFPHLYVWSGVWQNMGWSSIIYLSALSAVSQDLHEAARIDGASRLRRVFAVDIPAILPTVSIMLILRFGNVLAVGRDKVYLMQNSMNEMASEVISTYVYKNGLAQGNYSYGTAVSLMNTVINTLMLLLANFITNKISDGERGMF